MADPWREVHIATLQESRPHPPGGILGNSGLSEGSPNAQPADGLDHLHPSR